MLEGWLAHETNLQRLAGETVSHRQCETGEVAGSPMTLTLIVRLVASLILVYASVLTMNPRTAAIANM